MDGLQEVGICGREFLREALTNCSDPLKAIEEFQLENGILLPSLQTMLPLLDLHRVPRHEFYLSVREELKEKLLNQIENLNKLESQAKMKKLNELLEKSFPVINVPPLQPVVMSLLRNLDHVDDKYLKLIVADKELYSKCDVSVKRQIWQQHQGLFGDEVSPLFSQYIKEKELVLFSPDPSVHFHSLTPKQRRSSEIIQSLVKIIGKNVMLYDTCLQFLRTLFLKTKNSHYCTLRVELLMALHDAEVQDITAMDPCHKFVWCLDACIREQNIDPKRSRELQGFLEGVRKGQEQVIGDLSVTLSDSYAINFLASNFIRIVNHTISSECMPRDNPILILILRMLNLGLHSWDILNSQVYREPKLDGDIITKFIPILTSLVVDDQVRHLNQKLPVDDRESALLIIEHSGPPPDSFSKFIVEDRLAAVLGLYYSFQVLKQKDKNAITRVMGCLSNSYDNKVLEDAFLHVLVNLCITMTDDFAYEDFCTVIFDEIFITGIQHYNVPNHLVRLVYHIYHNLPQRRLELIMSALASCQLNETCDPIFKILQQKVLELNPLDI